jgi:hypothetical protein
VNETFEKFAVVGDSGFLTQSNPRVESSIPPVITIARLYAINEIEMAGRALREGVRSSVEVSVREGLLSLAVQCGRISAHFYVQ